MLDLSQLNMDYVALHRVGNKSREESNFESGSLLNPSPEVEVALLTFFLGPFSKSRELMRFTNELGASHNHMFKICSSIFSNPKDLLAGSVDIPNHLFEQSTHPHIRLGELFVTYFTDMVIGDEVTDAIGIFKAETLHDFVKVSEEGFENLLTNVDEGILVDKLDKGCHDPSKRKRS